MSFYRFKMTKKNSMQDFLSIVPKCVNLNRPQQLLFIWNGIRVAIEHGELIEEMVTLAIFF